MNCIQTLEKISIHKGRVTSIYEDRVRFPSGFETEDIQVKKVATDSLDTLIEQREICDALTISQVFLLKKYLTSHFK